MEQLTQDLDDHIARWNRQVKPNQSSPEESPQQLFYCIEPQEPLDYRVHTREQETVRVAISFSDKPPITMTYYPIRYGLRGDALLKNIRVNLEEKGLKEVQPPDD